MEDTEWFGAATTEVCRAYFGKYGFYRQQIESYERFMEHTLPSIVETPEPLVITHDDTRLELSFTRTTVLPMYHREQDGAVRSIGPDECRQRKLTYQNGIVVDITQRTYVREGGAEGEWRLVKEYDFFEVALLKIPCMLRSKFCVLHGQPPSERDDFLGGYFIVNGADKTVQAQIKLRSNSIHVFKTQGSADSFYSEVRSCGDTQWRATSTLRVVVGPADAGKSSSSSSSYHIGDPLPRLVVTAPSLSCPVPLATMCRLLGTPITEDLLQRALSAWGGSEVLMCDPVALRAAVTDPHAHLTDEAVLQVIGKDGTKEKTPERRNEYVRRVLRTGILPHLRNPKGSPDAPWSAEDSAKRIVFIAMLAGKALRAYLIHTRQKSRGCGGAGDDRDNWRFKKVDCTGALIAVLMRQLMRTFFNALSTSMYKALDTGTCPRTIRVIDGFINARKLETNVRYHFSTGSWTVMRGVSPSACSGVCAALTRITPVATISALNRINCPVNREGKTSGPRLLHCSDWGNACCVETPEGGGCGLVLNFCALTHVRQGYETEDLSPVVLRVLGIGQAGDEGAADRWRGGGAAVLVNGAILCVLGAGQAEGAEASLRAARRRGVLPFDTSIVRHGTAAVYVNGDPGVCLRPVVVAATLPQYLAYLRGLLESAEAVANNPWDALVASGLVEYIDTEEQSEHCVVATTLAAMLEAPAGTYTHMEVDVNLAIMGVTANLIPFADFNQSPRVIYQAAMGKQAIGSQTSGDGNRFDSNMYHLHYPQRPLCSTRMENILSLEPLAGGASGYSASTEAVVMIGAFDGFNQEDSILLSKAAVDRGFALITSYKTYHDDINGSGNDDEFFCRVESATASVKQGSYAHLDEDGFARVGSRVQVGDVIIGKVGQSLELGPDGKHAPVRRDRSTVVREPGIVDRVCVSMNKEGRPQVRVRVRQLRKPIEGDKFASRFSQKGVVGRLVAEEDLPFAADGTRPDIIINPCGFVSRMTIGMLIESLAGKAAAVTGKVCDATPFASGADVTRASEDALHSAGYQRDGYQVFYDGRTGERIQRPLFVGVVAYQRLRHLVEDKINSRARGGRHILTDQPMDGRAKGGGLRVGEMEAACIVSHGARSVLHERMFLSSDSKEVPVCNRCGSIAEPAHNRQFAHGVRGAEAYCRACSVHDCTTMRLPSAQRLMQQELQALQCAMRNF
ncbi:MAG: hypothetical protein ACO38I_03970 [Ilumatobacteraceae bacterium]